MCSFYILQYIVFYSTCVGLVGPPGSVVLVRHIIRSLNYFHFRRKQSFQASNNGLADWSSRKEATHQIILFKSKVAKHFRYSMASVVYFKFKSSVKTDSVSFDGSAISVKDLKNAIKIKCCLHSTELDLKLEDSSGKGLLLR